MVAGLLHDLGKLILGTYLKDELLRITDKLDNGTPYYQAEEESGTPHTLLGYILAKKWGLPDIHLSAILYHHNPSADPYRSLSTSLVALADKIVKGLGFGLTHGSRPIDNDHIRKQIQLDGDAIENVVARAEKTLPLLIVGWQQGLLDG